MMYKIYNGLVAIPAQPYFQLTTQQPKANHFLKFQQISTSKSYQQAIFFIQMLPTWNSAPSSIVEAEFMDVFKGELATFRLP